VTARVIELGDKKQTVTLDELPYIVSDVMNNEQLVEQNIKLLNYSLSVSSDSRPFASIKMEIDGTVYEESAYGEGQYNAVSRAMWKIYKPLNKQAPELLDYVVVIPLGGKTNALVQTIITWKFKDRVFKTRGLDGDQAVAAIQATIKMLNIIDKM
jgi:D-citramalate synthase